MKIAFQSLGCKVNKYETNRLKVLALDNGYEIVDFENTADVYCINSCAVTNLSERKTRQMISKAKAKNPKAIIAVLGCAVNSNTESLKELAHILLGNDQKLKLFDILKEKKNTTLITDMTHTNQYTDDGLLTKGFDIREAIKIEDGCDNFCSYCIIPYLRGRVRSRDISLIKEEAINLVTSGVKEVVLVGIEIASYGKDLKDKCLIDVLEILDKIEGLERIRLSSLEPRFLSKENISRLKNITKLCHHFHISVQSGCPKTLMDMNRKYDANWIIDVCKNLRETFNDCYLACDVIVGFPNETAEDFVTTVNTLKLCEFTELHVFRYSKRPMTRAAKMTGQVVGETKKERSKILQELSRDNQIKFLNKYVGQTVSVLFERYKDGYLNGYTNNYIMVCVKGDESLCGTIQDVAVTSLNKDTLLGELKKK